MPYTKKVWTDRTVERPLTFIMQNNADGTVTLIPSEGSIITTGTPITAASLNTMETQYDNAMADGLVAAQDWVKSFGLADVAASIGGTDLNALDVTGFYKGSNLTNGPLPASATSNFIVINLKHSATYRVQQAFHYGSGSVLPTMYTRQQNAGTWTAWKEIAITDSPSFIGTVTSNGKLIANAGSQAVDLKAGSTEDHVYMGFYADSQAQTTRSGYIGYPTNTHTNLWIANENGNVVIAPFEGGMFEFFGGADGHSSIRGEGKARIKFLSSVETVQIRNAADNNYSNFACWDMAAQNNITYVGSITDISVRELKKDIEQFGQSGIELLKSLPIYMFRYKESEEDVPLRMGSMADEVHDHFKYGEDKIDVSRVNWTTTKAVKELIEENDMLKNRLESVENRLTLLEKSLKQTKKKIN